MKNIKVPVLRFPEFLGQWEVRKLKDITKINQGLQIAISERYTEKVSNSYFYITNEFLKIGSEKRYFIKNPSKSVLCDKNDILLTRTGNTGKVVIGVHGAFHNNFFKIKYNKEVKKWFLYYFLTSYKTQCLILRLAGSSTIPDLNHSDFYRINIILPLVEEQQKIANFLSSIDKSIEKVGNQIEQSQNWKKGLLQKMFV